jgi:tRNA (guanine37-N1)-methyltransferase
MKIDILTIFPDIFTSPLKHSIIKRAQEIGALNIEIHNIRDYTTDKAKTTDDYPYGGGAGMVMKIEPIFNCLEDVRKKESHTILLSPQGKTFNQKMALELSHKNHIVLICGRYKGIDERVREYLIDQDISLGDFVTSGGEIPAMMIIDSVARLLPEVLGNFDSAKNDSFMREKLDAPYYTRPKEFNGMSVPKILLSGDHKKIEEWREKKSHKRTLMRRPDLLDSGKKTTEEL